MSADNHYALISAGGAGTRLWPLSRTAMPKQFQRLGTDDTLLQHMVKLTEQVIPLERICIMTVPEFVPLIQEQIPNLPHENILIEPGRRDNGPASALGMLQLRRRNPDAIAVILWADHLIKDAAEFSRMLTASFAAATDYPTQLITVGANPTTPDTGMGYIQIGQEVKDYGGVGVFKVKRFIEKPDLATATKFLNSWDYLWNVGYKVMCADTFLNQLTTAQPELAPLIEKIEAALTANEDISELYEQFPKLSIEYLFTQYLTDILVVPADMGWSDVGNWNVLHEVLQDSSNVVTKGPVSSIDTENTLIFARDRVIATVGVKDLIIVDAGDTILVMHKDAVQNIKTLHSNLTETNPELL